MPGRSGRPRSALATTVPDSGCGFAACMPTRISWALLGSSPEEAFAPIAA